MLQPMLQRESFVLVLVLSDERARPAKFRSLGPERKLIATLLGTGLSTFSVTIEAPQRLRDGIVRSNSEPGTAF